ncbi:MAG: hypothetical protein HZC28_06980 [Spirochaetes bacterium]|nr:hypothetical protein [Spirochaetota bacterium]
MPVRFIITVCMFTALLSAQHGISAANIASFASEHCLLTGTDTDGSTLRIMMDTAAAVDARSKTRTWNITSLQHFPGISSDNRLSVRLSDMQPFRATNARFFKEGGYAETFLLTNESVPNDNPKVFFIASPQLVMYVLRAFPFTSSTKEITIRMFGSRENGFNFTIRNNGLKRVTLKGFDACDAYELELGVDIPLFSAFIPKSYYYFRNDPQRSFVKFRGALMPGAKESELELAEYSIQR